MAENFYEGMFILDSNRYSRDPQGVASQVNEMIESVGGQILASRLWEERRLAYPIQGHRKGTYWLTYFRVEGSKIGNIERACQLNGDVLRVLFVRVDKRIIDTLVAHAQSGQATNPAAAKGEDEKEAVAAGAKAEESEG